MATNLCRNKIFSFTQPQLLPLLLSLNRGRKDGLPVLKIRYICLFLPKYEQLKLLLASCFIFACILIDRISW